MNKKDFDKLIKKDKHQVFLFVSAAHFPYIFAVHPWFVLNNHGKISRWEVLHKKHPKENIHLYKDSRIPTQGITVFSFLEGFKWSAKLLGHIEGDLALKMIKFIEGSKQNYPHSKIYSLRGTNSNTYAQWILDKFPDLDLKLPWNAFGKNHKS